MGHKRICVCFCRVPVKINFSGQLEHDHFIHLLAFAHHEVVGFSRGLFVFETKKKNP